MVDVNRRLAIHTQLGGNLIEIGEHVDSALAALLSQKAALIEAKQLVTNNQEPDGPYVQEDIDEVNTVIQESKDKILLFYQTNFP